MKLTYELLESIVETLQNFYKLSSQTFGFAVEFLKNVTLFFHDTSKFSFCFCIFRKSSTIVLTKYCFA